MYYAKSCLVIIDMRNEKIYSSVEKTERTETDTRLREESGVALLFWEFDKSPWLGEALCSMLN